MYRSLIIISLCFALHANGQSYDPLLVPLFKQDISVCYNLIYTVWNTNNNDQSKQYGEPVPGYGVSVLYATIRNRYFNFQTGLIYHKMTYDLTIDRHKDYQIQLNNLQIPLLAVLNTDKFCRINYSIFFGPQMTYNLSSSFSPPESAIALRDTSPVILSVNSLDFGIAYGGGGEIAINKEKTIHFDLGYRGSLGFTDRSGNTENINQINIIPHKSTVNTFGGYAGLKMLF